MIASAISRRATSAAMRLNPRPPLTRANCGETAPLAGVTTAPPDCSDAGASLEPPFGSL
jgi:hypothetical protein